MLKIRYIVVWVVNLLLLAASWMCYKFPQGDEYLVLFMIPLVFMAAPFVMPVRSLAALLAANLGFFMFYCFIGALNALDVAVLTFLLVAFGGASYLVRSLGLSFNSYYADDIESRQKGYTSVVNELETVDRRGRKVEGELSRIARLYELTTKLAPALKFEMLLDSLFGFLEGNFMFQAAHLLMFMNGKFHRGISKRVGNEGYEGESGTTLDYEKVVACVNERNLKSFFLNRYDAPELFESMKVRADTIMVFPMFMHGTISVVLALEGASKSLYARFQILVPQVALEFRKVELYEQVQELSIIDGLTEVHLRRYLMDRLEEERDRAARLGLTFSIGMVDVDHFKECNDRYGHLVGDAVLKKIAERLKGSVREVDMIARYGGEEFCILLPETAKELGVTVAERLRKSVEASVIKAFDEKIKATVSVGIATYPEDGKTVEAIIEKADTALYRAKRKGRNAVCTA